MRGEIEIKGNRPVELFEIGGRKYSVRLRPIKSADEWLDKVDEIKAFEKTMEGSAPDDMRQKKRELFRLICDAVFDYAPDVIKRAEVENNVTPEQIIHAFYLLMELTDPFDQIQSRALAALRQQMGAIPAPLIEKALTAFRKPASSSPLDESSD